MNEFDIKASEWDNNPMHWDRSKAIAEGILKNLSLTKEMNALEYGAGTGITSFLLKDHLKEILMMDNSEEMVKIMNEKIKASNVRNLKALVFDLEHNHFNEGNFDLIFTQMVLHHVNNIKNIIDKFSKLLNAGGNLVIADLYPEDGTFHGTTAFTGHKGFDITELSKLLHQYGFNNISSRLCFTINKEIPKSGIKQFDVFLLIASKS